MPVRPVFEPTESPLVVEIKPSGLYEWLCKQKNKWLSYLGGKMFWW